MFSSQIDSDIAKLETHRNEIKSNIAKLTELMDKIKGRKAKKQPEFLNYERNMARLRELDRNLAEDESRLRRCAQSIHLMKVNLLLIWPETFIGWACTFELWSMWFYGYLGCLLNLMVMLKVLFAVVELNGLRNWQAHKLFGSLVLCPLDNFLWMFFNWTISQSCETPFCFLWHNFIVIAVKAHFVGSHMWSLWYQYSDMKKPRPNVSNLGGFPA